MMSRRLSQIEIDEARLVFGTSLDTSRIIVYEAAHWPDWIARAAARIAGRPAPTHNAVTLGNRMYFPLMLQTNVEHDEAFSLQDMAWVIHELTHAWQYQQQGWRSFWEAFKVQIRLGPHAYDYGWEQGLNSARMRGESLFDFNPEQQGDIARHFYYRLKQGLSTQAWDPFVLFFRTPISD